MCRLEKQINSYFVKNENIDRIYQGDLLSNINLSIISTKSQDVEVTDIKFPYVVVLSQDCDLMQYFGAKFLKQIGLNHLYYQALLILLSILLLFLKSSSFVALSP
jgi:hypothetical protein